MTQFDVENGAFGLPFLRLKFAIASEKLSQANGWQKPLGKGLKSRMEGRERPNAKFGHENGRQRSPFLRSKCRIGRGELSHTRSNKESEAPDLALRLEIGVEHPYDKYKTENGQQRPPSEEVK